MANQIILTGAVVLVACLALTYGQVPPPIVNSCIICNSQTDPNCLFRPQLFTPAACPNVPANVQAQCFTRLDGFATVRGCLAPNSIEVTNCVNDNNCQDCQNAPLATDVCNRLTMAPVNRVRCHTCHGSRFGACGVSLQPVEVEAQFCPEFIANEQRCFTRRSDRFVTRGCVSNTTFCEDTSECLFCAGTGCNSLHHNSEAIPLASSADILNVVPMLVLGTAAMALLKQFQ